MLNVITINFKYTITKTIKNKPYNEQTKLKHRYREQTDGDQKHGVLGWNKVMGLRSANW